MKIFQLFEIERDLTRDVKIGWDVGDLIKRGFLSKLAIDKEK